MAEASYQVPIDGQKSYFQPPFRAIGLEIDNRTDSRLLVADDAGNTYVCDARNVLSDNLSPTTMLIASMEAPAISGFARLRVTDYRIPASGGALQARAGSVLLVCNNSTVTFKLPRDSHTVALAPSSTLTFGTLTFTYRVGDREVPILAGTLFRAASSVYGPFVMGTPLPSGTVLSVTYTGSGTFNLTY